MTQTFVCLNIKKGNKCSISYDFMRFVYRFFSKYCTTIVSNQKKKKVDEIFRRRTELQQGFFLYALSLVIGLDSKTGLIQGQTKLHVVRFYDLTCNFY